MKHRAMIQTEWIVYNAWCKAFNQKACSGKSLSYYMKNIYRGGNKIDS